MTITINAQGAERKRLAKTISDWLGVPAKYCGAPTFNYEVDYFTIDRNGSLSFDDRADSEVIERLLEHLYDEGFDIDQSHTDAEDEPWPSAFPCRRACSQTAIWKTSRHSMPPRAALSRKSSASLTCHWKSRTRRYPSLSSRLHPLPKKQTHTILL